MAGLGQSPGDVVINGEIEVLNSKCAGTGPDFGCIGLTNEDVRAVQAVDAARVRVNGRFAAILGVNPSGFRRFAAKPTAKDTAFWRSVESGSLGLSYEMGKHDKLPTGTSVTVSGRSVQTMHVGKFGTVGIGGVDAVITDKAARSLGFPVRNAIVISAPSAHFSKLTREIKKALPHGTEVEQLVVQTSQGTAASAPAGSVQPTVGGLASAPVIHAFLEAAVSRLGRAWSCGSTARTSISIRSVSRTRSSISRRVNCGASSRDLRPARPAAFKAARPSSCQA